MESIDPKRLYMTRDAVHFLDGYITELTLKTYCREGRIEAKKIGPRQQWHVPGAELLRLRKEWGLDG